MRWTQLALSRPVSTLMATVALLLFGWLALVRLPVDLLPELTYPSVTIRTRPSGAATTVDGPLSSTTAPVASAVSRAAAARSTE